MAKHLPGRPDNAIKNYWNACVSFHRPPRCAFELTTVCRSLIRQKRRRGESISTLAAALDISERSPSMAKSASSNSLSASLSSPRFAPYVRSTSMSKSRSEQVLSPGGTFSSTVRQGSTSSLDYRSPGPSASPFYSPAPMSRSQSYSAHDSYSPPTPRNTRKVASSMAGPISRDLNKEAFGLFADNSHLTPPATPSLSPKRRQGESSFPFGYAPPSPPLSATTAYHSSLLEPFATTNTWSEVQQQEVFNDALGFGPLHSFGDLQMVDPAFEPYEVPAHEQQYFDEKYGVGSQHHSEQLYLAHSLSYDALQQSSQGPATQYEELASPYIHPQHHISTSTQRHYHSPSLDEWGVPLPHSASPQEIQHATLPPNLQAPYSSYLDVPWAVSDNTSEGGSVHSPASSASSYVVSRSPSISSSQPTSRLTTPLGLTFEDPECETTPMAVDSSNSPRSLRSEKRRNRTDPPHPISLSSLSRSHASYSLSSPTSIDGGPMGPKPGLGRRSQSAREGLRIKVEDRTNMGAGSLSPSISSPNCRIEGLGVDTHGRACLPRGMGKGAMY
jgi:hypothetical protein